MRPFFLYLLLELALVCSTVIDTKSLQLHWHEVQRYDESSLIELKYNDPAYGHPNIEALACKILVNSANTSLQDNISAFRRCCPLLPSTCPDNIVSQYLKAHNPSYQSEKGNPDHSPDNSMDSPLSILGLSASLACGHARLSVDPLVSITRLFESEEAQVKSSVHFITSSILPSTHCDRHKRMVCDETRVSCYTPSKFQPLPPFPSDMSPSPSPSSRSSPKMSLNDKHPTLCAMPIRRVRFEWHRTWFLPTLPKDVPLSNINQDHSRARQKNTKTIDHQASNNTPHNGHPPQTIEKRNSDSNVSGDSSVLGLMQCTVGRRLNGQGMHRYLETNITCGSNNHANDKNGLTYDNIKASTSGIPTSTDTMLYSTLVPIHYLSHLPSTTVSSLAPSSSTPSFDTSTSPSPLFLLSSMETLPQGLYADPYLLRVRTYIHLYNRRSLYQFMHLDAFSHHFLLLLSFLH